VSAWRVALHLAALAVSVSWIRWSGDNPRVLVFAFALNELVQVLTIAALLRAYAAPGARGLRPLLERLRSAPDPGQESSPVTQNGTPAGLGGHLVVVAALGATALLLLHIDEHKQLSFEAARFARELGLAGLLAVIYWVEALAARSLTIDFDARPAVNYGYNSSGIGILAVTVLASALLLAVAQVQKTPPSPWIALGPLLAFKCLQDLRRDAARPAERP
jgi:hypothetical protein